jgi:hypothetical protein
VQLGGSRCGVNRLGHIHAETYACNRRAGRNIPRDVEGDYTSADQIRNSGAGEKVKTGAIANVTVCRNVLVESVIFAGINADHCCVSQPGTDTGKRERD